MNQANVATDNVGRGNVVMNDDLRTLFADAAETQGRGSKDQCRGTKVHLAPDALLLPGLGCVSVSKNGIPLIELQGFAGDCAMTVADAERFALAEPELEWCIHMVSLLDDRHYRREGAGVWRLFARGYGLS